MHRVTLAGLVALPTLLSFNPLAQAQCSGPGCAAGAAVPAIGAAPGCAAPRVVTNPFANCSYLGCGGFCFRYFSHLHQHGPLFNYGPYYGYYPFEPYGPWTADLRYNGPTLDCGGCGKCGRCGGLLGRGHGSWGGYAKATLANIAHRINPFGHKCHGGGCGTEVAGDVIGGTGVVTGPAASPVAQTPPESPVLQAGYPRRER